MDIIPVQRRPFYRIVWHNAHTRSTTCAVELSIDVYVLYSHVYHGSMIRDSRHLILYIVYVMTALQGIEAVRHTEELDDDAKNARSPLKGVGSLTVSKRKANFVTASKHFFLEAGGDDAI